MIPYRERSDADILEELWSQLYTVDTCDESGNYVFEGVLDRDLTDELTRRVEGGEG